MTGVVPIRPTAVVRPGCSAMPCAITSPRCASAVTVASVRPTPLPPTVSSRSQPPASSAAAMEPASRPAASTQVTSAPALRALSAISCAVTASPAAGILTTRTRGRRTLNALQSRRARDQEIARQHAPPGFDDSGSAGDIATRAANPLPRDRFRQHLNQRAGLIDGIGIEHAVAGFRHRDRRPRPRPAMS